MKLMKAAGLTNLVEIVTRLKDDGRQDHQEEHRWRECFLFLK